MLTTAMPFERTEFEGRTYIDIPVGRVITLDRQGDVLIDIYGSYIEQEDKTRLYLINQIAA